jgi:hypothetical protein
MPSEEIFSVYLKYAAGGQWQIKITDLIFRDGLPIAVLVWDGSPDKPVPRVSFSLDPTHLRALQGEAVDYQYGLPLPFPPLKH